MRSVSSKLPGPVAMTRPACRMVAVAVYANRGPDGGWLPEAPEIFPVVALVARNVFEYSRYAGPGSYPRGRPTHRGMERDGWGFDGAFTCYDALIVDTEQGLSEAGEALGYMDNGEFEVACCPWPESEDFARLAGLFERLSKAARGKVGRREAAGEPRAAAPCPPK